MSAVLLCQGTALALPLREASVHCCVTSPPYWGLRDYGTGAWQGGEAACAHRFPISMASLGGSTLQGGKKTTAHQQQGYAGRCGRCGAVRVDQQIGLEESPEEYIAAMVQVFREVHRVLHPMGTCWINMGTTYRDGQDLGIPWRLAFALKDDGWRLRSEIIYAKLNPMPESLQTRPTRAHETVFLFVKQARYFFDMEGVRENHADPTRHAGHWTLRSNNGSHASGLDVSGDYGRMGNHPNGRACRSVWSLASEPTPYAHYACMPTALVRRCLLAGAPSAVCAVCQAPYRRVVERQRLLDGHIPVTGTFAKPDEPFRIPPNGVGHQRYTTQTTDHGFAPTCACQHASMPCTVLDPFCGSGTTLLVARDLGHHAIGLDLSYPYLHDIARTRLGLAQLAAWTGDAPAPAPVVTYDDLPLFGGF